MFLGDYFVVFVDVLFLDIMLGNNTAFDLLEIVANLNSKIIFVTASDIHAIKAFKFAAIDYILKPYTNEDLTKAINRAKSQIKPNIEQLKVLNQAINNEKKNLKKISLHTLHKVIVVDINNIVRCQSDNNYTMFHFLDNSKILVSKTLKYYADILKDVNFLRVHQSHLINKIYIKEFIKSDGGYIVLSNRKTIPVSVRKRAEILESLKEF